MIPEQHRYTPAQKLNAAVTSATCDTASKETTSYVPPEVIAQITQTVLEKLQSGGLDGSTPIPPPHNRFSPPPQQPVPLSPSTASGTSQSMPNRAFTPPSPLKHSDYSDHTSSPLSQSTYPPEAPHSPHEQKSSQFSPPRRSSSSQSLSSNLSDKAHTRPKGPSRLSTSKEVTTLERIWGPLFDEESNSTVRLGQLLRGLAVHIVCSSSIERRIVARPSLTVAFRLRIMSLNIVL